MLHTFVPVLMFSLPPQLVLTPQGEREGGGVLCLGGGAGVAPRGRGAAHPDPQRDGAGVAQVDQVLVQSLDVHGTGLLVETNLEELGRQSRKWEGQKKRIM